MEKGNYKRAFELFWFSFLRFWIGANKFGIKFCIKISNSSFFKNVGAAPRKAAKLEIFDWNFSEWLLRTNDCKFGKLWDEKFGVFSRPGLMAKAYTMLDFV